MTLKCLIVDDEKPARDKLRTLLANEEDLSLVGEANSSSAAVEMIAEHRPNLAFLDIQMPGGTGFDVIRSVPEELMPRVIFTTAYDQYAVEAFSVRAIDYLLKPFSKERLLEAVARARDTLSKPQPLAQAGLLDLVKTTHTPRGALERILVRLNERYLVVRSEDIDWIEAAANYVVLHTKTGNHVLRKTLSALEEELSKQHFFRVSRSCIVNLDRVAEIQFVSAGEHTVVLTTGAKTPLTRGVRELQERLQFLR